MAKHGKHKWIAAAIGKPGALHRDLGIPEGQKIPAARLEAAAHSDDPTTRRRALLAKTLRHLNPWEIRKEGDGYWVVRQDTGERVHKKAHKSRAEAVEHMQALYAAEGIDKAEYDTKKAKSLKSTKPPSRY